MSKIDTTCEHLKLRLIAAAVGLQQCERTAANIIPLPGGDRVVAIGTPAEVAQLLGIAPTSPADSFAINFIEQRAAQYLQDHADTEPDTGAVVFQYGEAGREYHSTLVELADDIRTALQQTDAKAPAACTVPPAGWYCTRAAGHEGPCAAHPTAEHDHSEGGHHD